MSKLTKQAVSNHDYPVAATCYGKVRGIKKEDTFIFRGIKYANAKRFHMPEEVKAWEGIRSAISFGPCCLQKKYEFSSDELFNPHYFLPMDENCQYLNIWTPSLKSSVKRPVMFWIHGGAWSFGSSMEIMAYDGENMSQYGDVVVVSLNHRLNWLGYLDLSSFGEQYRHSMYVGLADIVAALRWIHDNIANFGGDPDNVMIFGQSGGACKVLYLLQTSEADGLFHKAAVQSGGGMYNTGSRDWTKKQISERVGELTASELCLNKNNISQIEIVSYNQLSTAAMAAAEKIKKEAGISVYRWEPVGDKEYCWDNPYLDGFRKETLHIPMIIGSVFGERNSNLFQKTYGDNKNEWDVDRVKRYIKEKYGESASAIADAFKNAYPSKTLVDVLFVSNRKSACELMKKRAILGGKVWNYIFSLESPFNGGTVAWHCAEIPFVFHNADRIEAQYIPGITERLQDEMCGAWLSLAKTGNPNHRDIPEWKAVTKDSVPTMIFDKETYLTINHDKPLDDLLPHVRREEQFHKDF
jgi:para-nitrobenzyl esterase